MNARRTTTIHDENVDLVLARLDAIVLRLSVAIAALGFIAGVLLAGPR